MVATQFVSFHGNVALRLQVPSSRFSQFRIGALKVLQNVFELLLHVHNKPEMAIIR
jgi:hypothetical protein